MFACVGKVPLHHIAIAQPHKKLKDLMDVAPSIHAMATKEEVLEAIEKETLLQIPVIDINNHLLGIIRNDAIMSASKEEMTESLQAMFGAGREEHALSKVSFAVRKRLPWLQGCRRPVPAPILAALSTPASYRTPSGLFTCPHLSKGAMLENSILQLKRGVMLYNFI